MKSHLKLVATAALAIAVAGCNKQPSSEEQTPQLTLHEVMKDQIDKHADELWDVSNKAIGAEAGLDPSKMDDKTWAEIARLAGEVQSGAKTLAALDPIVVAKPGVKISDEDVPYGDSAAEVQANVDKNPQMLRDFANTLAGHMGDLIAAANARDAAKAGPLIDQLDSVCEDCHLEFWYPHQKALVEKYRNAGVTVPEKK